MKGMWTLLSGKGQTYNSPLPPRIGFLVVDNRSTEAYAVFNRLGQINNPEGLSNPTLDALIVTATNSGGGGSELAPDPNLGITWTVRATAEANSWRSVTYGNGVFVAVAFDGTNWVMTSPDGVT